ncbi:MAG: hypothetical protein Q4F49_02365 [Pseudoxanthomonas suwonensis]|nr:hypothetical protein [Pseudoxanthomonas suwonensis]
MTTTWNKQARGTVWFPHGTTGPHIVAHEAVHVAQWAMQLLGDDPANYRGIVPGYCPSWKSGGDEVLAEAFARIVDQFVERFELERARRGYLHR